MAAIEWTTGEEIRHYRRRKGWDQDTLARAIGVSRPTVSKWERNVSEPTISQWRVIIAVTALEGPSEQPVSPSAWKVPAAA